MGQRGEKEEEIQEAGGEFYVTPGWETSENQVKVEIDLGIGVVTIRDR